MALWHLTLIRTPNYFPGSCTRRETVVDSATISDTIRVRVLRIEAFFRKRMDELEMELAAACCIVIIAYCLLQEKMA